MKPPIKTVNLRKILCPTLAPIFAAAFALHGPGLAPAALGEDIVRDGQPRAEIVITEKPPRMVKLAAEELQTHIEKISGATLPIVTEATDAHPVAIYVGRSKHTDALGLSDQGLDRDAFRMVSGDNWLALLGKDSDFVPQEPWARGPSPDAQAEMFKKWDALTGHNRWGNPAGVPMHRQYSQHLEAWSYDERGSLNAVYQFLRDLGVEWYMPGDLGMVMPETKTIALPKVDREVRADFALRHFMFSPFFRGHKDDHLWYLRLGLTKNDREMHPHGMRYGPLGRAEMREAHPEYYAMYGGQRGPNVGGYWHACFSSEGLFDEIVRYVRFMFDHYDEPVKVDLTPEDGFSSICECELCKGKSTPERGSTGVMSDYVWEFVNRVAQEVYKTHPDRIVTSYAYSTYLLPPTNIEQLSPNLRVSFDQTRTFFTNKQFHDHYMEARQGWIKLLAPGQKIWTSNHYPYTDSGHRSRPMYLTRIIANDLRALKGISEGEFISGGFERNDPERLSGLDSPEFAHLNVFVTARYYWDASQDLDELLETYYTRFYGPAAEPMKAFIEFCEVNHSQMRTDAELIGRAFERMAAAQAAAPAESVYGQRIARIANYIQPLKNRAEQLGRGRENVPEARAHVMPSDVIPDASITIDGRLDEPAWQGADGGELRELITGSEPESGTTFKLRWSGSDLYIGIICREVDTDNINIGTSRDNDGAIWNGDVVEVLLETQSRSYYQITISPAGAVYDMDCTGEVRDARWSALAEVATHIGEDYWSVEIRIPIADEGHGDPLHNVVGRQPDDAHPWHFNIGRARIRESGNEFTAFSPTGVRRFPVVEKMAKLVAD